MFIWVNGPDAAHTSMGDSMHELFSPQRPVAPATADLKKFPGEGKTLYIFCRL